MLPVSPFEPQSSDAGLLLAEGLDDWVCQIDPQGFIRWSSGRSLDRVGQPPADLIGRRWVDVLELADTTDSIEPPAPGGLRGAVEGAILRLDGSRELKSAPMTVQELLWTPQSTGPSGGPRRWALRLVVAGPARLWALARDITALQRLEAERSHQSEVLDTVRRFGRVGVWEREIPSGRGRWDETSFRLFGFDPADGTPTFQNAASRVHPDDALARSYLDSTLKPGDYQSRYRVRLPDGSERMVRSQWAVLPGQDGRPTRTIGVMSDETELEGLSRSFGVMSEQLRLAAEMAAVGLWVHDLAADRIFYNDQLFQMAGRSLAPKGLTVAQVRETIHPDDLPVVQASVDKALASSSPVDFEARYRRADGSWRHVLSRRVVRRDPAGRPVAFLGVSIDVTEQVLERQRNQDLAFRLEQIVETAGVGIWRRDLVTDEAEWNAQLYRIYGVAPGGKPPDRDTWLACVHPEDRAGALEGMRRARERPGRSVESKYRIHRPDGETRWLDQRATCTPSEGGTLQMSGITLDVTDRARAEAALRSAADRAALAARAAGVGTWSLDCATGEGAWDEQMFRLRGLPSGGPTPDRAGRLALVHPDDRYLFADGDGLLDATGDEGASYEFRVVWPDGQVRWLASRSRQVVDANGKPVSQLGVNWDVTDRRAAEQVREEREAARRESRAKSAFLARMSHELRTPLNAVLGFTQLLQGELLSAPAPQRMKLDHIHGAGEHLLALINEVLDLTHLEAGSMTLDLQPIRVSDALEQALPLVQSMVERQQVRIRRPQGDAQLMADPMRLRQILVNILSNAIKFNRPGGEVRIRATSQDERTRIVITDEGVGIPAEQLDHLFEPFNRLGVRADDVEGTGIGLVIVKALCEAMHGSVRVSSHAGGGTEVEIELPASCPGSPEARSRHARAETQAPAQAKPSPGPGPGAVLYIEDNPVNVLLVRELIATRTTLTLHVAETGQKGLDCAARIQPDLVLVDMQLPDMDGHEVLRQLREREPTRALPCVALSANALREDIERALEAGFEDYWTKPIDFAAFLQALGKRFPPR